MISIEEIKKIAKLKGINNLGNAEKDYLLDIVLLSVSRITKDELVFKGGTCLYKFYKLDRFSEDIDFTLKKEFDVDDLMRKIVADLELFGIEANIKDKKRVKNSLMITVRTKGPLYSGNPQSLSNIRIDINLKSEINREPVHIAYTSLYPDVPSFSLIVMHEDEILAEKVRAIMMRSKARDVYDLWFLIQKGVRFDESLIKEKMKYYNEKWALNDFEERLALKETIWKTEMESLVPVVPEFPEVKRAIMDDIRH